MAYVLIGKTFFKTITNPQGKKRSHFKEAGRTLKEHLACCKLGLQLFEDRTCSLMGKKTLEISWQLVWSSITWPSRMRGVHMWYDYLHTIFRPRRTQTGFRFFLRCIRRSKNGDHMSIFARISLNINGSYMGDSFMVLVHVYSCFNWIICCIWTLFFV